VRHFRDQIDDPEFKREIAGFIGQEAVHAREHRILNDRFAELGYPTKGFERFTQRMLGLRMRLAPPIANLASTAAMEHFTATLAELLLTDESTREIMGDNVVADFFMWHALEESEHKAVAFDVYQQVGGTERMRVITMRIAIVGLITSFAMQTMISLAGDRETYRRGKLRASWKRIRATGLMRKSTLDMLRDYNREGFHPNDSDTSALIEEWRERLFGEQGALVDKLPVRAAA
jgi:predicted metal-dependent hydrolase